jgi:arylsulfatase A-like enzyme
MANLPQGFDVVEHPWMDRYLEEASRIVSEKIDPRDQSSELTRRIRRGRFNENTTKASGALIRRGLTEWLDADGSGRPWFAYVNYMEAHRPLIPPEEYRRRFLDEQGILRSYRIDRSWTKIWRYTFDLFDYSPDDLEIMRTTYDAALAELDDLLEDLVTTLERRGDLANTIVVLVSDHGEQLGEHHMIGGLRARSDRTGAGHTACLDPRHLADAPGARTPRPEQAAIRSGSQPSRRDPRRSRARRGISSRFRGGAQLDSGHYSGLGPDTLAAEAARAVSR